MAVPRTPRLVARALVVGSCAVVAACGFTGVGSAPSTGVDAGAGATADGAGNDGNPAFDEGGVIIVGGDGAAADATTDADAGDGTCPSVCTSCTGTTCNILCDATHPCATAITCPPRVPCHVTCNAVDGCASRMVSCGQASSCLVDCVQFNACVSTIIDCGSGACRVDCTGVASSCVSVILGAASAASLCLKCDAISGQPGCVSTDGTKPAPGKPCDLVCTGGGCNSNGNGLNGCVQTTTCP